MSKMRSHSRMMSPDRREKGSGVKMNEQDALSLEDDVARQTQEGK
jgi:hypothetical protein